MFLIIHNPLSNHSKSKFSTHQIVRFFQRNNIPFFLRSTLKIENLNAFLKENPTITDILYMGGDGSINYMINTVDLSTLTPNLYLQKSGSGNDFLRSLRPLHSGSITLGEAKTNVKNLRFINGCGMGIDGLICHFVNNDSRKNKISYFINAYRAFTTFRPLAMDVTVDGVTHHYEKTFLCAVQNGKYFGGGMKIAPKADATSDTFQVVVAHSCSRALISLLFLTIYSGFHVHIHRYVDIFEGKKISIHASEKLFFQAEGEVTPGVDSVEVQKCGSRTFTAFNRQDLKHRFSQK